MHPKVAGLFFTEDHKEMMNPAAYNVSMTEYVVTTDPILPPHLPLRVLII